MSEELKTAAEWHQITMYEKMRKKYRGLLSFLLNDTIPKLEKLHALAYNGDFSEKDFKENLLCQIEAALVDLKDFIVKSID
jgi:hypothetical protein